MPRIAALLLSLLQSRQEVVIRTHAYTPPSATLRAETNLVEAPLTVRDSLGRAVPNLHASDFEVFDNGVPQKITAFSELRSDGKPAAGLPPSEAVPQAAVPRTEPKFVTFFFDDNHLNNGSMLFVERAAHAFIAKGVKPNDKMSIVTASGEGDLDFTADQKLFADKLDHLHSHTRPEVGSKCGIDAVNSYVFLHNLDAQVTELAIDAAKECACGGSETPSECRARALPVAQQMAQSSWEQTQAQNIDTVTALGLAAKRLAQVNGTRILVLTSTGFLIDAGDTAIQHFIDGAVRWNIVVHAIDAAGLSASGGLKRQALFWMPLEKITDGTGGHFFKNNNDLAAAMDLAANPEVSYLLAFNPGARDGKFHTLKIRLKTHRSDDIQFRPGYFSPVDQIRQLSARASLDDAVFSQKTLTDIPASVSVSTANAGVTVKVSLDVNRLQFVRNKGRHVQQIVFLVTLLDASGAFVAGKESIMDLSLTDEKLASLQKEGLRAVTTLQAPAGASYQVRTIVREAMKGNLSASTTPVNLKTR